MNVVTPAGKFPEKNLVVFRNKTALTAQCERSEPAECSVETTYLDPTVCASVHSACCDKGGNNTGPNEWTLQVTHFSEYALVDVPCDDAPRAGCTLPFVSGKAQVQITDKAVDRADKLKWKWLAGSAPMLGEFGSPTTQPGTDHALCVYAGPTSSTLVGHGTLRAGGMCGTRPCWRAITTVGFDYKNSARLPDGLDKAKLRVGREGKAQVQVQGKGVDLLMSAPPMTLPVRVQLQGTNGSCRESVHTTARTNAAGLFRATAD